MQGVGFGRRPFCNYRLESLIRCFEVRGERPSGSDSAAIKKGDCSMTKLELLYAQKSKKFDEVCALVARELGYSELPLLSDEDRSRVEDGSERQADGLIIDPCGEQRRVWSASSCRRQLPHLH
jgi:hypothetical protein